MFKKLMIIGCTLLLLTACGTDTTEENANTTNQSSTTNEANNTNNESSAVEDSRNTSTPNTSKTVDITNPTVSMTEAVNVFKEAHPDAKIESIDLDSDFGRLHYDIDGFDSSKEYETEIDATTKEIKENEVETERDTDESLDFSSIIDPARAIEISSAKAEVEGLSPTGWTLEADDGKQTYTIEYEKNDSDIEIKINTTTEEILEVEIDD
ncbi:PepSY domain-containing protein [Virgibacillus ainsalahensis]